MPKTLSTPINKPKPRPTKNRMVSFRLSSDGRYRLAKLARDEDIGPSTFARMVVEQYLKEHG